MFQIIGEPSQKLMEKMGTKEKERIKAQQQALGEKGLTANRKRVEKAIQDNEVGECFYWLIRCELLFMDGFIIASIVMPAGLLIFLLFVI